MSQIPIEKIDYKAFLKAWINKAVLKGGFDAQEASDALTALEMITKEPLKFQMNGEQLKSELGKRKEQTHDK